jgi:hypothetical protein
VGAAITVRVAVSPAKQGAGKGVAGAKAETDESGTAAEAMTVRVCPAVPPRVASTTSGRMKDEALGLSGSGPEIYDPVSFDN